MSFQIEHDRWIQRHMDKRRGERLDALKRGHGFGNRLFVEKVWWPLVGHLDDLHPEYEVRDWRGRSYFVDFAWVVGNHTICIEIMDYGSHGTDRSKYRLDLNRMLYLQSQSHVVIAIALDELKDNPAFILGMMRNILSPFLHMPKDHPPRYSRMEREILRYAVRNYRIIRPSKAASELELHKQTVIKYCRSLAEKGKLRPVPSRDGRIYCYEYIGPVQSADLL